MGKTKQISPKEHKRQIRLYKREREHYKVYADVLKRILETACELSIPEAVVQARAKTVSSFAEKCARRFETYPNAVRQMTDLCGARVIVQTLEQVQAVRKFIEANFRVVEQEDKGMLLGTGEFGYRDMHYIVQLRPVQGIEISREERQTIGRRKAEIQVRTWVQHAWADTLHDRMYKPRLKPSEEMERTGALLAALMEDGDEAFNRLAIAVDSMLANYTAHTPKDQIAREIAIQDLIVKNEPLAEKKPALALQLARLLTAQGNYAQIVRLLDRHKGIRGPIRCDLLLELGYALCKVHHDAPTCAKYRRGQKYLEEVIANCECERVPSVPNVRRLGSQHARAMARLAWSWGAVPGEEHRAREYYQRALEEESANPYYLADVLGFEIWCDRARQFTGVMRAAIRAAIGTCRQHAEAGIEMPYACFTAGRLHLLLGEDLAALSCYARGIHHVRGGLYCVPTDVLETEIHWLQRVNFGDPLSGGYLWAKGLLDMAKHSPGKGSSRSSAFDTPLLIVAGSANRIKAGVQKRTQTLLTALRDFHGTIVSGGTTSGVPGCVGDLASRLAEENNKGFELVGYLPEQPVNGATIHESYDERVKVGDGFSPAQILRYWSDLLKAGIDPKTVLLVGFAGGPLSAVEYRIALAMGAGVGLVRGLGGAADELMEDPLWSAVPNLFPLPADFATLRAFVIPSDSELRRGVLEDMAKSFHANYLTVNPGRLPANMRPWNLLGDTFKVANYEQAKYSIRILEAGGFGVRKVKRRPRVFKKFTDEEVESMAALEHGRWNVERLHDGWRYGKPRDDTRKIHDWLLPWKDVPEYIRNYDRTSVRVLPAVLAQAGLEVYRKRHRPIIARTFR
jgi:ppGpp synthetase/RelA/SpoT-type nucleotidyltranferase